MRAPIYRTHGMAAALWGAGGTAVKSAAQMAVLVVLSRLLGPDQYGLFATGVVVITIFCVLADWGLAYSIAVQQEMSNNQIRFVFTWQFVISTLMAGIVFYMSSQIGGFFADARAQTVVAALSPLVVLNTIVLPAENVLKRSLDFRAYHIAHLIGYTTGYVVVGIPLALLNVGVWALVAAWIVQSFSALVLVYFFSGQFWRPLLWYDGAADLLRFCPTVLQANLVNWTTQNVDRFVVAKLFSAAEIGIYTIPFNLLAAPSAALLSGVQPVFLSLLVRRKAEPLQIGVAYRTVVGLVALVLLPVFISVAAVSDTVIVAIYGMHWQAAAAILRAVALAMPLFVLYGFAAAVLWACGRGRAEYLCQAPLAAVGLGLMWGAGHVSVGMVAWTTTAMSAARFLAISAAVQRYQPVRIQCLWASARGGVQLASMCGGCAFLVDGALRTVSSWPVVWLAADVLFCLSFCMVSTALFPWLVTGEVRQVLAEIVSRVPGRAGTCVRMHPAFNWDTSKNRPNGDFGRW